MSNSIRWVERKRRVFGSALGLGLYSPERFVELLARVPLTDEGFKQDFS